MYDWSVLSDVASKSRMVLMVFDGWRLSKRPLTRPTPLDRPFGLVLIFTENAHAHRQLFHTGYHGKV